MPMCLRLVALLALLAGPVGAEPAGCDALARAVQDTFGLRLSTAPAPVAEGWCVVDGVRLEGESAPRITLQTLRIRGEMAEGSLMALEVEGKGLRVAPSLNDRKTAPWLRDFLRLQTSDMQVSIRREDAADRLLVQDGHLLLSGGAELALSAEIAGAGVSAASLLTGRVTGLHLEWKNDGRTLRPVMEAMGAQLEPEAEGTRAVLAARDLLSGLIDAMPGDSLPQDTAEALERFVAALPQGRGRLVLDFASEDGIGAARLGLLALAEDPMGPAALARVFAGSGIGASWTPGLTP